MPDNVQPDKNSEEATLTALATNFGFNDKVRDIFVNRTMENLEDFRHYFSEEKEIEAFAATEKSLTGLLQRIQISRVRRAWAATRPNSLRKENINTMLAVAHRDDLPDEVTLREAKAQFWKRYKSPAEVNPLDQLLSRCYREMDNRLLTVYDIWKVKTLFHQVMTTKKSSLWEEDEPLGQSVQSVTRDAHWDAPIRSHAQIQQIIIFGSAHRPNTWPQRMTSREVAKPITPSGRHNNYITAHQSGGPKKMAPVTFSGSLREGKSLCPDFNRGRRNTKGPSGDKGAHRRAKVSRNGRPCGLSFHGAHIFRNP